MECYEDFLSLITLFVVADNKDSRIKERQDIGGDR